MGRLRAAMAVLVVLAAGALIGSALSQYRKDPERGAGAGEAGPVAGADRDRGRIRVEVLNAGGVGGAARSATDRLRDAGFDVVYFGNADEFGRDSSVVLDRVGALAPARDVADALGIRSVRSVPDSNLYLDVSVWLGTDWPAPTAEEEPAPPPRPWWDPRGWLPVR